MIPPASLRERLAWYAGALVLTCLLVFLGLRLDRVNLRAPFYYDLDALLILPMVKATAERGPGGHWRNERMGAGVTADRPPDIMDLHDYPVIDFLHFTLIWLLSKVVSHVVVLFNFYFLLTFPLTTLTAMIAFRHLGLTLPAAAVGGLLYSFLPYHYQRWENHYFLAAYWMVPLSLLPVFAICRGGFPFFNSQTEAINDRPRRTRSVIGLVLLCVAVASAGAYYAFFACALTAFAGLYSWVVYRTWRPLAAAGRNRRDHVHRRLDPPPPEHRVPVAIREEPDHGAATGRGRHLRHEDRALDPAHPRPQPERPGEPSSPLPLSQSPVRGRELRLARHRRDGRIARPPDRHSTSVSPRLALWTIWQRSPYSRSSWEQSAGSGPSSIWS